MKSDLKIGTQMAGRIKCRRSNDIWNAVDNDRDEILRSESQISVCRAEPVKMHRPSRLLLQQRRVISAPTQSGIGYNVLYSRIG